MEYVVYLGGSGLDLTVGERYEVVSYSNYKIQVVDNSGTRVWVSDSFFQAAA